MAVEKNRNEELENIKQRISNMCYKAESILNLCVDGFIKQKVEVINEAKNLIVAVRNEENELIKLLSDTASSSDADKGLIKTLIAIVSNIEMAIDGLDSVLQHIKTKAGEGILFSDKAVNEICHLFKETLGILRNAGDAITTKSDILRKHIIDKYMNLNEIVDAYSEEHEERLIKGICQPRSSSLYLNIVDSMMKVVWHIKQAIDRYFSGG